MDGNALVNPGRTLVDNATEASKSLALATGFELLMNCFN
jgi:hypothetical protein